MHVPTTQQTRLLVAAVCILVMVLVRQFGKQTVTGEPVAPAPGEAFRQRIVAVGDLHGDIHNAKKVFRMARLIDKRDAWAAGSDIFVQTGDIVDRGGYAIDIYKMMQRLRGEAAAEGGKVVSVMGNHEFMNALSDWRYVTPLDIKQFGGSQQRREAMSIDGWLGQEWLANYSVTARVPMSPFPDAPTLSFTHGSLRPSFSNLTPYPDAINKLGHVLLTRAMTPPLAPPYPPNPYQGLPEGTTKDEQELYGGGGPLWARGLAEGPEDTVCKWAKEIKEKIGVRRIIGGHTPNFEHIVSRCDGQVIIIDTGISSAYGGVLSALEIIYTLTPVPDEDDDNNGHREDPLAPDQQAQSPMEVEPLLRQGGKYIEREEVYAIYEKHRQLLAREVQQIIL